MHVMGSKAKYTPGVIIQFKSIVIFIFIRLSILLNKTFSSSNYPRNIFLLQNGLFQIGLIPGLQLLLKYSKLNLIYFY